MAEIDVAVFAFDGEQRLRLVNRAGERLLAQPARGCYDARVTSWVWAACLNPDNGDGEHATHTSRWSSLARWPVGHSP